MRCCTGQPQHQGLSPSIPALDLLQRKHTYSQQTQAINHLLYMLPLKHAPSQSSDDHSEEDAHRQFSATSAFCSPGDANTHQSPQESTPEGSTGASPLPLT